ncbi:cuticle protein-like [Pectinophora gossypiella]|uniref:cuticle protein-like n=1 Tax=Pectinophora gossypiella TaxID=13191 RepID=UPI00214E9C58|nr:cuticle protein-like [Pectinophora gossypiella]
MFTKIVTLSAILAVSAAGLLPQPHYSSAAAVSSQSIVRHDEGHATKLIAAAPVAKLAYQAAPVAYHAAPAVSYHAAPAVSYHAAPAAVTYHAAPVAKVAVAAPVAYHAPAPVAYHAAPVAKVLAQPEEYSHPKYEYSYSVADGHTGDNKSQQESRDGDAVHGQYSLLEADGSVRTVQYSADDHNGFNAVVSHSAPAHAHAAPALPIPVVHHAIPVVHHAIPIVHHSAPIVQSAPHHHAIPVVHHAVPIVHHAIPIIHHAAPIVHSAPVHHEEHHEEHHSHPKYEFAYSVEDKHTGDIKSQHESRDGHLVKGEYSLHQPDGSVRTVKYTADKHSGFNADVHYSGHSQHIEPQHHHHH